MLIAFVLVCAYAYIFTGYHFQEMVYSGGWERWLFGAIWPLAIPVYLYWLVCIGINKAKKASRKRLEQEKQDKKKGHNS